MKFYEKLALLRKQKGLSQEELADILEVSRQSVYKWESGSNMPDMSKLDKLRQFFNVTYEYLLNEDAEQAKEKIGEKAPVRREYRDVFVSSETFDQYQEGYEHGYSKEPVCKVKDSENIFNRFESNAEQEMQMRGYKNIVRIGNEVCFYYFEDPENHSFGIWFNGAEQFVCPAENYVNMEFSNSGVSIDYTGRTDITGVGVGDVRSASFGSVPQARLDKASSQSFTIVYRDKTGEMHEYKQTINTKQIYLLFEHNDPEAARCMWNVNSELVENNLSKIFANLRNIQLCGERILAGEIEVSNIDLQKYTSDCEVAKRKNNEHRDTVDAAAAKLRRKTLWKRVLLYTMLGICVAIFGLMVIAGYMASL